MSEVNFSVDNITISNFVHQIISPLNGILGTLDNLVEFNDFDKQKLTATKAQLAKTIEMIRNLAYISQLSTKEGISSFVSKNQRFNVSTLIINAIQFFQTSAKGRDVKIFHEVNEQYWVNGHESLLKQVIMNMVDNALKYGTQGKDIWVKAHIRKKDNLLCIEIINNGCGFDFSEKEDIFSLGYRGKDAKNLKAGGSGIGLFICKQIIEEVHHGTIMAEHSRKNGNTTFRILLPHCK